MREAEPDGKRLRAINGMARGDGGSCQRPNWMLTRPAQLVERPNGRRCQCSEAKAADAAARRLRASKRKAPGR